MSRPLRVLVACEYSGVVRDAFIALGHTAMSCDLLPSDRPGPHYQGDVRDLLLPDSWDLMIAHPDCTYLTCSAEWAYGDGPYHQKVKPETLVGAARRAARLEALDFFRLLEAVPIPYKAIENPAVSAINTQIRKPDQTIHPHQFGHDASKITGLWLQALPSLVPTCNVPGRLVEWNGKMVERWGNQTDSGQNKLTPSPDRWKERARTYQGWADAMSNQWSQYIERCRL